MTPRPPLPTSKVSSMSKPVHRAHRRSTDGERPGRRSVGRAIGITAVQHRRRRHRDRAHRRRIRRVDDPALVPAAGAGRSPSRDSAAMSTVQRDVLGIPTITAGGHRTTSSSRRATCTRRTASGRWTSDGTSPAGGSPSCSASRSWPPTRSCARSAGARSPSRRSRRSTRPIRALLRRVRRRASTPTSPTTTARTHRFEYAVLGLQNPDYEIEPWTPADSVAWLKAMAWDLRSNIEDETERALARGRTSPRDAARASSTRRYPVRPQSGDRADDLEPSAVGRRCADGRRTPTIVTTASIEWSRGRRRHRGRERARRRRRRGHRLELLGRLGRSDRERDAAPRQRSAPRRRSCPACGTRSACKCRVVTPDCPFDVSGFGFSGVPGVIIGHNDRIAWGFTNLTTDVTDLYLEKVDGDSYWRDGALVPLEERTETIEVAGGDDVELVIRSTGPRADRLGPHATTSPRSPTTPTRALTGVVAEPAAPPEGEYAVSLQWTALEPGTTAASIFALNLAQDFDDFRAAAAAVRRARAEPRLRRRRRQHRLPDARQAPDPRRGRRLDAAAGLGLGLRLAGLHPLRGSCRSRSTPPRATSSPPTTRSSATRLPLPPHARLGLRLARRAHRRPPRSARSAIGKLTADDMRDIQADNEFSMGKRLAAAYSDVSRPDARGPDAALDLLRVVGRAERRRLGCRGLRQRAVGRARQDLFVTRARAPGAVTGQGRLFLVVERSARRSRLRVVDQRGARRARSGGDARARRRRGLRPARRAAGRQPVEVELGLAARADRSPATRSARRASRRSRCSSTADRIPVGGGSSVANATGWDIGADFETRHRALDAHGGRPRRLRRIAAGTTSPARAATRSTRTTSTRPTTWQRAELTPWAFTR